MASSLQKKDPRKALCEAECINQKRWKAMKSFQTKIAKQQMRALPPAHCHSVEFVLDAPHPIYQFKLWRSECNCVFLLVKDSSEVLPQLKIGSILPMKYLSGEPLAPMEIRKTEIKNIINERKGRFEGHHRVELAIVASENDASVQSSALTV